MLSATLALAVSVTVGGAATSAFAAKGADDAINLKPVAGEHNKVKAQNGAQIYAVQLRGSGLSSYDGSMKGFDAPARSKSGRVDVRSKEARQYTAMLKSRQDAIIGSVGAQRLYNYVYTMNGFSAVMTPEQVSLLKRNADVITIWRDEPRQMQTDTSREYIGLSEPGGLHGEGVRAFGEDIVVGIVDGGIWPENPSFSNLGCPSDGDPVEDPLNQVYDCANPVDVYGEPPETWNVELNAEGSCQFGNTAFNPEDAPFECNGKLLAARAFGEAFKAFTELTDFDSARDGDGHGSHTASTAAGNANVPADVDGQGVVNISGMAPRARIAAYRSCFNGVDGDGCFPSDSAAAFEQAYFDGVDVINFSVGGSSSFFGGPEDAVALFLNDAGVFVANSNGNSGPNPGTVGTSGLPWWTSVGAMNDDGVFNEGVWVTPPGFFSPVLIEAAEGTGGDATLEDLGLFNSNLVIPEDPANWTGCAPWINEAGGQTAIVGRGGCAFSDKYNNAAAAGAPAILVFNDRPGILTMFAPGTTIPGLSIFQDVGIEIFLGVANGVPVNSTLTPDASFSKDATMAGFSSRGPNPGMPDVIKPDVSAPGVDIGAASAPGVIWENFNGTSMASPHAAGLAAGLRQRHQGSWQSSWFKSAMMTTARNGIQNDSASQAELSEKATPFDVGAGQIVSGERANGNSLKPGIVYANSLIDHQAALCGEPNQAGLVDPAFCASLEAGGMSTDPSDLNLASIGIAELVGTQTVHRTVTCTGPGNDLRSWNAKVTAPPGIKVTVDPATISCERLGTADFTVTFEATENATFYEWVHGRLVWIADDNARVRSPISIYPVPVAAPASVQGTGTDGSASFPVSFGYDGPFMSTMDGLVEGLPFEGAIADGDFDVYFFDVPEGVTVLSIQMSDADVGAGDGSDDLELNVFGPDGEGYPFICGSFSPTSEERCDIANPVAGNYAVGVADFASAEGPTPYTVFVYQEEGTDAGNSVVTAPAQATNGATEDVTVDWTGLNEGTKYFGTITHSDGVDAIGQTETTMDTRTP